MGKCKWVRRREGKKQKIRETQRRADEVTRESRMGTQKVGTCKWVKRRDGKKRMMRTKQRREEIKKESRVGTKGRCGSVSERESVKQKDTITRYRKQ